MDYFITTIFNVSIYFQIFKRQSRMKCWATQSMSGL